jgi:hypothetical protein
MHSAAWLSNSARVIMAQSPYYIIRVCQEHLRRIFLRERIWEKALTGELAHVEGPGRACDFIDFKGNRCISSHEVYFYDESLPPDHLGYEVARAHWYRTAEGAIGGSGLPDPKDLILPNTEYQTEAPGYSHVQHRLRKEDKIQKKEKPCRLCERDPIPDEERSWEWKKKYRPDLLPSMPS